MSTRAKLDVKLDISCIPMPKEHVAAWRAGISLLLQFMDGDDFLNPEEARGERMDLDLDGDIGGSIPALLSLEEVAA